MGELAQMVIVLTVTVLSSLLSLWLARSRGRREDATTVITNVDAHPQVLNVAGDIYNINISTSDQTVVEPVADLARTANDHQADDSHGGGPATDGFCPFEAPARPEL